MARHIPLPAFLSTTRSRVISVAAAGTLTLAAAVSAAAATLPATFPASASVRAAGSNLGSTSRPVTSAGEAATLADSMRSELAAAKASAAKDAEQAAAARKAAGQAAARRQAAGAAAARKAADAAAARQAAADQAAQQAQAQPTEQAQPAQQATATVTAGSAQQVAEQMLSQFGWSQSQFSCLDPLWAQESGWQVTAENPGSGAYGIPQALPGSKMASAGADWETDAATQIRWGLTYIKSLYGSPCGAWAHEEADGWY